MNDPRSATYRWWVDYFALWAMVIAVFVLGLVLGSRL